MRWLSKSIDALYDEVLAPRANTTPEEPDFDVVVVGSGYGGAVAAARFARANYRVCVLERGREYLAGEFPSQLGDLPAHIRFRRADWGNTVANPLGLFDISFGAQVATLTGNALGGGSQINANVGIRADRELFKQPEWPREFRDDPACLDGYYAEAERSLGITPYPNQELPRYANLAQLAAAIAREVREDDWEDGGEPGVVCYPAPLAVSFADGPNAFGIEQKKCVGCGDCVTGCNFQAKNTLTMNYLPDAVAHGAKIYTGVTVAAVDPRSGVERNASRRRRGLIECLGDTDMFKRVYLRRTEDVLRYRDDSSADPMVLEPEATPIENLRYVTARIVVLAAGAVGSTEILLRSRDLLDLQLSPALGAGFSANGDGLGFGTLQDHPVDGVGCGARGTPDRADVGPTITGVIDTRARVSIDKGGLIEDGAIPGAIAHLWQEMLAASASFGQLDRWTVFREHGDRAGLHPEFRTHTQTFLLMGRDDAGGTIRLRDGHPEIRWPGAMEQEAVRRGHRLAALSQEQGGLYVKSPLSNPLSDAIQSVLDGPMVKGIALTVHPLGGCRMGDSFETAVVSHRGEVYSSEGGGTYDNLFVWDGAILPGALAVNPFLTITALAERAADLTITQLSRTRQVPLQPGIAPAQHAAAPAPRQPSQAYRQPPLVAPAPERCEPGGLEWHETMRGVLRGRDGPRHAALTLKLEMPDVPALAADPRHRVARVSGCLKLAALDKKFVSQTYKVVDGEVELMVPSIDSAFWRRITAPWRWLRTFLVWLIKRRTEVVDKIREKLSWATGIWRRGQFWHLLRKTGELINIKAYRTADAPPEKMGWLRMIVNHVKLVGHASDERVMRYHLRLRDEQNPDAVLHVLEGSKRFDFRLGGNVWDDLLNLRVECGSWHGELRLDIQDLADAERPRMMGQADLAVGAAHMLSLPTMLFRTLLPIYLWDLRAPALPSRTARRDLQAGEVRELAWNSTRDHLCRAADGIMLRRESHTIQVGERSEHDKLRDQGEFQSNRQIPLLLTRYQSGAVAALGDEKKEAIILLHGFAQSSLAFAAPTVDVNLVQYLCAEGFDVWLLDYRTSTVFSTAGERHNLDHCAAIDLPAAIKHVRTVTGRSGLYGAQSRLHLAGHCMGSAISGMALLSGQLVENQATPKRTRLIDRLVLMQVPPVVIGTAYSQARRQVAAFLRDTLGLKGVPLNADDGNSAAWSVMDRVFATYPNPPAGHEECCPGEKTWFTLRRDSATCKRVSSIIGRLYLHDNLNDATHRALDRYFGFGNMDVFAQVGKLVEYEQYVDTDGYACYLTADNIRKYGDLDILFLHGARNFVFDPLSAKLSRRRFASINPHARYRYEIVDGFAHFDCLVGEARQVRVDTCPDPAHRGGVCVKAAGEPRRHDGRAADRPQAGDRSACEAVFPLIVRHLRAQGTAAGHANKRSKALLPASGPVIGHIHAGGGGVRVRLWAEPEVKAIPLAPSHFIWSATSKSTGQLVAGDCVALAAGSFKPGNAVAAPLFCEYITLPMADDYTISTGFLYCPAGVAPPATRQQVKERLDHLAKHLTRFRRKRSSEIKPRRSRYFRRTHLESDGSVSLSQAQMRAACSAATGEMRIFLGSCRYPGAMFDKWRADTALEDMAQRVEAAPEARLVQPSLVLLAGDQVYADARAGLFDLQSDFERYPERYADAWSSKGFAALTRQVPVMMVLDDHEISNDHSLDEIARGIEAQNSVVRRRTTALEFYESYQALPGPAPTPAGRPFTHGGYPFVLFDGRSGRLRRDMLSPFSGARQYPASIGNVPELVAWLIQQQQAVKNAPKFVATGSVIFPGLREFDYGEGDVARAGDMVSSRADNWQGFVADRTAVFCAIAQAGVANVIFLSGDYHCGAVAEMTIPRSSGVPLCALSIVTPALYAPVPFANLPEHQLILDGNLYVGPRLPATYKTHPAATAQGYCDIAVRATGKGWDIKVTTIAVGPAPEVAPPPLTFSLT